MAGEKAHIKIRIGAAMDASVAAVFKSVEKRAEMAANATAKANKKAGDAAEKEHARAQKSAEKSSVAEIRAAEKATDAKIKAAEKAIKASERAAAIIARANAKAEAQMRREAERTTAVKAREASKQAREAERAEARAARVRDRFATRTSHRATRFFVPNAPIGSMARRVGSDLLRGAGLDMSMGGSLQRNLAAETQASQLANAAFIPGAEGPAGTRVDPAALVAESNKIGSDKALDPERVRAAMSAYTSIAGDLEGARNIMADLADLSIATTSDLEQVAKAAGQIGEQFDAKGITGEAKLKATNAVLRQIAMTGKIGSIEMADMAVQIAKVAAGAGQFGGDLSKNMATLTSLMMVARKFGGATSAAEAGTAASSFVNTFNKNARVKQFEAAGVNLRDDNQQLRDPLQIIRDSIAATKGDPVAMNKLFMDVRGGKMVLGLANAFRDAGGVKDPKAGLAAVDKLFRDNSTGALKGSDIATMVDGHLKTGAARIQQTQIKVDEAFRALSDTFTKKLAELTPSLVKFAETLGDITTWVVDNPKKAIGAAITLAIGRAAIESVFRASLEQAMIGTGVAGAVPGGGRIGAGAGAFGATPGMGKFGSIAVQTIQVASILVGSIALGAFLGEAIADAINGKDPTQKKIKEDLEEFNAITLIKSNAKGKGEIGSEVDAEIQGKKLIEDWEKRIARLDRRSSEITGTDDFGNPTSTRGLSAEEQKEREKLVSQVNDMQKVLGDLSKIPFATLKVHVVQDDTGSKLEKERTNWVEQ